VISASFDRLFRPIAVFTQWCLSPACRSRERPAARRHCGAAFMVLGENDEEKPVLVQEVARTRRHRVSSEEIAGCIREAVTKEHEIAVHKIVLLPPGVLPKTTSGRIQRNPTRNLRLANSLEVMV
jgi:acyl-CoA synthetase (AMP-forming)/AMP-acid ligase II